MKSPRVLLFAAAWLLFPSVKSPACSCLVTQPAPSPVVLAQAADAVFSARVVGVTPLGPLYVREGNACLQAYPQSLVTLRVIAAWKGVHRSEVILVNEASNCAYPFKLGREYFIYAHAWPSGVGTNLCSYTRPLSESVSSVPALGAPELSF
jgi:hypothetical protein